MIYKIGEVSKRIMEDRCIAISETGYCNDMCKTYCLPATVIYDTRKKKFSCFSKGYLFPQSEEKYKKLNESPIIKPNLLLKIIPGVKDEKFRSFLKKKLKEIL